MIAPIPAFVFGPEMRIQNISAVRDGIVYVGVEVNGQFIPYGTGFLINVQIDAQYRTIFAITATHVIKDIPGEVVSVRLNRKSGGSSSVSIEGRSILGSDQNDIALIPLNIRSDVFDYKLLDFNESKLEAARAVFEGIYYGDEVYAVGLYTSHYGLTKNIPVVRIGHVALLPGEEPVRGPGGYVDAYLIELRTIGGLSGSPVFLNPLPSGFEKARLNISPKIIICQLAFWLGIMLSKVKRIRLQLPNGRRMIPPIAQRAAIVPIKETRDLGW